MTDFLKRNTQFIAMLIIWVMAGWVMPQLGMVVALLSVVLLKRKNMYAELIMGFIFILVLSDSRQYQLEFAKITKDIYLVLLTLFYLFDQKQFKFKNSLFLPFIPFLAWSFFTVFRSYDMVISFQKTLSYGLLYFTIPAYFIKSFRTSGSIFLKDFIMLMALIFITGLLLIVVKPDFVYLAGRYSGILGNPNGLGIFVVVALMFTVCAQIKFPGLLTKNEMIFIYSLMGISALLTGSRNAIMCFIIFLVFTKFYKISYWYGFMTVVVAIMLYQVVFTNLPSILEALGLAKALRADTLESGSGRLVAWGFAMNKLNSDLKLFFMGGGFSFDEYIFYLNINALSILGHQGGVHNTFLALWLNTGIIGLGLWLTGFFRIIFKAVKISYTAFPLMYTVLFSTFFEAWLMGSLNPFHIMYIFTLTMLITEKSDFADGDKTLTDLPVEKNDT
jgi:O-antigen ligase